MHILFLTRSYGERAGGMERLSHEMIEAVKKQPGITVSVVSHNRSRASSPLFNIAALPRSLTLAKRADIIHLGDPMLSFLGWLLKLLAKKPVAVTVHGLDITYPNFLYQLYLKIFFTRFNIYFPISKFVGQLLQSKYQILDTRYHILTPGITDRFFDPSIRHNQLSQLLKRDTTNKRVLFTSGRLIKRKGHAWFIENVLPKLPDNVIYVVAGEGREEESIKKVSKRGGTDSGDLAGGAGILNVSPAKRDALRRENMSQNLVAPEANVILLGRVTDDQLKVLYNTVDAFIMPNIPVENDVEGFGLVLLEAALCQRPVFASNVDGIPDAIRDGRNGTLIPPQNPEAWITALTVFLKNPQPNPPARNYTLKHFSWSNLVNHYAVNIKNFL